MSAWGIGACPAHAVGRLQFLIAATESLHCKHRPNRTIPHVERKERMMSSNNRPHGSRVEMDLAGRTLSFETGLVAQQADGAVVVRYGDSTVLTTVVGEREPNASVGFFPLTVEYEERMYAAGKIPEGSSNAKGDLRKLRPWPRALPIDRFAPCFRRDTCPRCRLLRR